MRNNNNTNAKKDYNFSSGNYEVPFYCSYEYLTIQGLYYYPHWHDNIEFLYINKGKLTIYLDRTPIELTENQLLYIAPNVVHTIYHNDKEPVEYFVYALSNELVPTNYIYLLYPQELTILPTVFTPNNLSPNLTPALFRNILKNFENKKFCYEFDTSAFLLQLVSYIFNFWKDENLLTLVRPLFKERHEKIKSLLDYVSQHYSEDLSPMYAAQLCCTSYSNFCKLFKHAMGTSFTIFLNNYRINEAKKLLLTTDVPIKEIAIQVGFDSCSYFIKLFRKRNDISPSLFRKTMKDPLKDVATIDNPIEY